MMMVVWLWPKWCLNTLICLAPLTHWPVKVLQAYVTRLLVYVTKSHDCSLLLVYVTKSHNCSLSFYLKTVAFCLFAVSNNYWSLDTSYESHIYCDSKSLIMFLFYFCIACIIYDVNKMIIFHVSYLSRCKKNGMRFFRCLEYLFLVVCLRISACDILVGIVGLAEIEAPLLCL